MNVTGARWIALAGVAALTIIVVLLATLALQRSRGETTAQPNPVPSFTLGVTTPTPTASTEAPSPANAASRAEERFLTAGSAVWWRGVAGQCGATEPLIERSDDGGATWTDVTPRYLGVGQVMAISAFSAADAEMVAAVGPACEVQALRTYTDGQFWEPYPEVLATSTYIDVADPDLVVLAGGPIAAPCPTGSGLRTNGETTAVVCDTVAWLWNGADWAALPATEVSTLNIIDGGVLVTHRNPGCEGSALSRVPSDDPATLQPLGCAPDGDPRTPSAVTTINGRVLLWSGETFAVLDGLI